MIPFKLSKDLGHTWFIDLDGTILKHNGYVNPPEELLPGVKDLWATIPSQDTIILTTGRNSTYRESTLKFLDSAGIRYDHVIFDLPLGERIVVNDTKPGGLKTAIAWNLERNQGFA